MFFHKKHIEYGVFAVEKIYCLIYRKFDTNFIQKMA